MPLTAELSDNELLHLLKSGDRNAFTELYSRYWKKMFTVAAGKTGQPEEAEEIVQDIFISLWHRRDSIHITTTLAAYLAVSVKYRVIKLLAKRYRQQRFTDHALEAISSEWKSAQDALELEELRSRLELLVAGLPEKCRLVYRMSRDEGLSQKEIAANYGISEKTVEAHIGKALKTLRTGLGQLFL